MLHTNWYFVALRLPVNGLVHADAETVVAITAGSSVIGKVSRFDCHSVANQSGAVDFGCVGFARDAGFTPL